MRKVLFKNITRPVLLCSCLFLVGCSQRIEYVVKNSGPQAIQEVLVKIGSAHSFRHGTLIPDAHSSYSGGAKLQSENNLTLSWREESGKVHEKVLPVSKKKLQDKRVPVFIINAAMEVQQGWRWAK